MIFFPEQKLYEKPADYGMAFEDAWVPADPGVTLHGWYLKAGAEKGVLLFFHGNAGNIANRLYKAKGWIELGFSVFLVDYRGYGQSTGKIRHENDVYRDARAALEWLRNEKKVPPGRIVLYGESLGSAPAVRLASEERFAALILEAPFTSFVDLARVHYPFVGEWMMKDFRFSNLEWAASLKTPLFIMHGTHDEICPYEQSEQLFENAPEPKGFFSIPGGTHNDLPVSAGENYWAQPYQFVTARMAERKG
jgi:dipeptidyl aminopeptidase/acylaminoacyl peptidase